MRLYEEGPNREAIRIGWVMCIFGTRWHLHYCKKKLSLVNTLGGRAMTDAEKLKKVLDYCTGIVEDCDCGGGSNRSEAEKAKYDMAKHIWWNILNK